MDRFATVGGGVGLGVTLAAWWVPAPDVAFSAALALLAALIAKGSAPMAGGADRRGAGRARGRDAAGGAATARAGG